MMSPMDVQDAVIALDVNDATKIFIYWDHDVCSGLFTLFCSPFAEASCCYYGNLEQYLRRRNMSPLGIYAIIIPQLNRC